MSATCLQEGGSRSADLCQESYGILSVAFLFSSAVFSNVFAEPRTARGKAVDCSESVQHADEETLCAVEAVSVS